MLSRCHSYDGLLDQVTKTPFCVFAVTMAGFGVGIVPHVFWNSGMLCVCDTIRVLFISNERCPLVQPLDAHFPKPTRP